MSSKQTYPKCYLGSVVSPGEYWLVSKLRTHVQDVRNLEELLSDEMNEVLTIPDPASLDLNSCVAVENPLARGVWQRGKIISKLGKDIYKVFLIDYGNFTEVNLRQLQIITASKFTEVEPLAFRLCLHGLVPCIGAHGLVRKQVSEGWSQPARDFINDLFSQKLVIYVKKNLILKRTVFGDMYLVDKPDGQLFSLGKLLCVKEFAVYSESYYREKVMHMDSSVLDENSSEKNFDISSELNMKLERVKEWQLSTCQYQAKCLGEVDFNKSDSSKTLKNESESESLESNRHNSHLQQIELKSSSSIITTPKDRNERSKNSDGSKLEATRVECNTNFAQSQDLNRQRDTGTTKTNPKYGRHCSSEEKKEFQLTIEEDLAASPAGGNNSTFGIFTLFSDSIIEPLNTFRNLNISQNIILNLEQEGNFTNLSAIQRWAIPSIQRGHNVVMLSGSKTGKTLSYIIPLLEMVQDKVNAKEILVGNGPIAVILCSGSRSCEFIYDTCQLLLGNYSGKQKPQSSLRVQIAHGSGCERESWIHLTNGCEILVTTPHCLVRLLKYRGVTNLERLNIMVLDEVDIITQEPFLSPVKIILYKSKYSKDCQRIFCGERWTQELASICYTFAKNHALLIASYLEVAIYAELKPDVLFVDKQMKAQALLDMIVSKIGTHRILIGCENTAEVIYLYDVFKTKGHVPLIAHSGMVLHDLKSLQKNWKYAKGPGIIICTDDVIRDLGIEDVQVLIHYSLPKESKTNFGYRFSTLMKSCKNRCSAEDGTKRLHVVILIDDENHYQLPHIVEFVLRLGGKLPETIRNMSDEILRRIETNKKETPICSNLLEFGECKSFKNCTRRHALIKEVDSCQTCLSGLVKFKVIYVHDVCYLSVRLIEVIKTNNERSRFKDISSEIYEELQKYYAVEENRRFFGTPELNDLCAVELIDSDGSKFHRSAVLEYKKLNALNQPVELVVKLIDIGSYIRVSVYKLYELPEELKKYPPQAFDVYLCNLLPNDFDMNWSEPAVTFAKKLFLKKLNSNQFWLGKIAMALNSSIHLDRVKLCHTLENLKTSAIDFCARGKLLSNGIAVENDKHLEKLYTLCEKADIELPKYEQKNESITRITEPQWSFLDESLIKVQFLSAESTSSLFVRLAKFKDLVKNLENECQTEGEKTRNMYKSHSKLIKYEENWSARSGMYCLALYRNSWNRARIQSIENDKFLVFFIDYGDFYYAEEVVPISDKLLLQLPAQAIECCLTGINHDSKCSDEVLDEIYMFSEEGKNDVYVNVIGKDLQSDMTGGRKYEVNLLTLEGISLNKKLVDAGLVVASGTNLEALGNLDIILQELNETKVEKEEEEQSNYAEESFLDQDVLPELVDDVNKEDYSHFLRMPSDVYEDENAQILLEEFMTQIFPGNLVKKPAQTEGVSKENIEKPKEKNSATQNECCEVKKSSRQYLKQLLNESLSKKSMSSICEVVTYTPQILWSQNHSQVQIKIMLNNITGYKFDCSLAHIVFRCSSEGKLYVVSLKLFGSINPQLTQIQAKTFFVLICLKKLCPLPWSRLQSDKRKYRWIKFDVEDYSVPQNSYLEGLCKRAMKRIESGQMKCGNVDGDIRFVSSSDSSEGFLTDSDEELDGFS